MKISFTTMATPHQSAAKAIRMAGEYGYQGIDLRVSEHMGEVTLASSKDELRNIRHTLLQEGLVCPSLLCYNEHGDEEAASWEKMENSLVRHIMLAEELGVESIRIFTGKAKNITAHDDFLKRTVHILTKVLDWGKSEVALLIQNHRNNSTAMDTVKIIQQLKNPRVGMVFSPDHCMIENENMDTVFQVVPAYAKQMYFADICVSGSEFKNVLPGKGQVPLKQAYRHLMNNHFQGWVTFKWEKIWHPELDEPEIALPFFTDYFKDIQQ